MKISVKVADVSAVKVDALVVTLVEGSKKPTGLIAEVDSAIGGDIARLMGDGEIKGKKGQITVVHSFGKIAPARVVVLGLGKPKGVDAEVVRECLGTAIRMLLKIGVKKVAMLTQEICANNLGVSQVAQAVAEGALLGCYTFGKYKRNHDESSSGMSLLVIGRDEFTLGDLRKGVQVGKVMAESVCLARDLVNEPANRMGPTDMADVAAGLATDNMQVRVMDEGEMGTMGMGAILGVAKGSAQAPRFVVMTYCGDLSQRDRVTGFVGKGVTFDTGGISLKPAGGMALMKTDMAGGAAVIAAMRALSILQPKINVTGLIPLAENMPSSTAQKPGDIVTALNGKTIEVENTDAEGRLLLADALSYGRKIGLGVMIDVATLTGAMSNTFGSVCTGAFTNHQATLNRLMKAAVVTGERIWQLPMFDDFKVQNSSEVADVKNTGGRIAGAITAAWFLAEFAESTPWVHLDIAGTARSGSTKGYQVKGASGVPVRTLVQFALDSANRKQHGS